MNYRQSCRLMKIALGIGAAAGFLGALLELGAMMALGVAAAIAGVVQAMFFCRCPYCGESLEIRGGLPNYCPVCGKKLI